MVSNTDTESTSTSTNQESYTEEMPLVQETESAAWSFSDAITDAISSRLRPRKPHYENAGQIYLMNGITEPRTVKGATQNSDAPACKSAMDTEMQALIKNQTQSRAPYHPDGSLSKRWARMAWRLPRKQDLSSKVSSKNTAKTTTRPVVSRTSLRVLKALKAVNGWKAIEIDFKSAFLNRNMDYDVFMAQSEGYVKLGKEGCVCHLKKSLYGLKQAPML